MTTRPPGRPPLDDNDPSVDVRLRVPSKQYDKMYADAQRERLPSVAELIRRRMATNDDRQRDD
jgi:hypothetical protein